MTAKADFSEEEWNELMMAPMLAGMLVIAADLHITSVMGEMKGMMEGLLKQEVPPGADELVGSLITDLKAKSENKEKMEQPDLTGKEPEVMKAELLEQLEEAAAIVDEHCSPKEAHGYKEWVVGVAKRTAEAGREGGFLGIGSVRVSDKEKQMLGEISEVLGLM